MVFHMLCMWNTRWKCGAHFTGFSHGCFHKVCEIPCEKLCENPVRSLWNFHMVFTLISHSFHRVSPRSEGVTIHFNWTKVLLSKRGKWLSLQSWFLLQNSVEGHREMNRSLPHAPGVAKSGTFREADKMFPNANASLTRGYLSMPRRMWPEA